MGRGDGAWAVGTAITLFFAALVSGAGPTQLSPSSSVVDPGEAGPPVDFEVGEDPGLLQGLYLERFGDSHVVQSLITWTGRLLLVLAGAVVLLVIVWLVRNLIDRLRGSDVAAKDDVRGEVLPDVLRAGLTRSEAQLERGASGEAVINAWLALEHTAQLVGVGDDTSRTPAELVKAVLERHDVDLESLARLADVYREARFSAHPIGEPQRETARSALRQIRHDLERPLLTAPERTLGKTP
ncbi:DUF4129 domain-containing protein [Knoellia sp. S7-12]|uniref:DUF4129 domain-containing protein n=1 Tax=Knoellia sp. S7-12 TaxID=3126698 RepID=UPI0033673113